MAVGWYKGLAHLVSQSRSCRGAVVPCKHIMTLNSREKGEKLFKSKDSIHVEATGNTFRQDFIYCFSLSVY